MPIKQSAKKALRQAKKRALANKLVRDSYKQIVKTTKKAIVVGEDAIESMKLVQQKLDKAAKKGVIKKKTASRRLSRLVKQMNKSKMKKAAK